MPALWPLSSIEWCGLHSTVNTTVKDLGEKVNDGKSLSLGFIREKNDEAVSRLHRLEWIPATLQTKAKIVQSSVWPLALYSSDTIYIGSHHFTALRRAALTCLVGKWHYASQPIACTLLFRYLIDPFLHTVLQCFRILRRIATTQMEVAIETVREAVEWSGSRPYGPATTLRQCLKQLGWPHYRWACQWTGVHGIQFASDSVRKITKIAKAMWSFHMLNMIDRKGVGDFIPGYTIFHSVFHKLTDENKGWSNSMLWGLFRQGHKSPNGILTSWIVVNFAVNLTQGNIACYNALLWVMSGTSFQQHVRHFVMSDKSGEICQFPDAMISWQLFGPLWILWIPWCDCTEKLWYPYDEIFHGWCCLISQMHTCENSHLGGHARHHVQGGTDTTSCWLFISWPTQISKVLCLCSWWKFTVIKIKSHRTFESARKVLDLWFVASNMCADAAANAAYMAVPSEVRALADDIVNHMGSEKKLLYDHCKFLADFNRCRCRLLDEKRKDDSSNLLRPRQDRVRTDGLFDSSLMGIDACKVLAAFRNEACIAEDWSTRWDTACLLTRS